MFLQLGREWPRCSRWQTAKARTGPIALETTDICQRGGMRLPVRVLLADGCGKSCSAWLCLVIWMRCKQATKLQVLPQDYRELQLFFCEKEGNSLNFASEYNSIYTNHLERARPSKQAPTGPICKISTLPEDTPVFTTLSRTRWSSRKIQQPDTSIESLLKCWTPIGSSLFESGKNKIRWHSDGRNKSPTKAKEAYLHLPLPRHLDNEHSKGEEDQKLQMAGPQRRGNPSYNPKTKELSYISKTSPRSDESPPSPAPGRPQEVEMRRDRQQ
jgi:hypothetical protein